MKKIKNLINNVALYGWLLGILVFALAVELSTASVIVKMCYVLVALSCPPLWMDKNTYREIKCSWWVLKRKWDRHMN